MELGAGIQCHFEYHSMPDYNKKQNKCGAHHMPIYINYSKHNF